MLHSAELSACSAVKTCMHMPICLPHTSVPDTRVVSSRTLQQSTADTCPFKRHTGRIP